MAHCSNTYWTAVAAGLWCLHSLLEYWLGKTDKVKASSMIDAILIGTTIILVWIVAKFKKGEIKNE